MRALEDERKERLHWFHTMIWMPSTRRRRRSREKPFDRAVSTFLRSHLPGFCCNLLNHSSHLTGYSFDRFTQKIRVSYSKQRRGVISVTCQNVIKLYETRAVTPFTHLLTPVLLAAHGIHCLFTVMLACLLVLPSLHRFLRKRETAHSLS